MYKPDAKIVGEDYHELFLKDFAPFLTKVMAAQPDVLYTCDWMPDGDNLLIQARNMGLNLPIANIFLTNPDALKVVGPEGSKNLINCFGSMLQDAPADPALKTLMEVWNKQWTKWKAPYNKLVYKWPFTVITESLIGTYWMFDVIEKAGTTNPEKIIDIWEGYEYHSILGTRVMRAEDHQAIYPMFVGETSYPTKEVYPGVPFTEGYAGIHNVTVIPMDKCTPPIPEGLKDRLKK